MENLLIFLHDRQKSIQDVLECTKDIYFVLLLSMEHDIARCAISLYDLEEDMYRRCHDTFERNYFDGKSIQDLADMVHAAKNFEDLDVVYDIISSTVSEMGDRLGNHYYK